jgi:hypothetical protein
MSATARKEYRVIRTVLIAALLAAMPATAVSARETSDGADKPAKEKRICRRDPHTGSIMQRQVCKTRAEWDAADAAARANGSVSHGGDSSRTVDVH